MLHSQYEAILRDDFVFLAVQTYCMCIIRDIPPNLSNSYTFPLFLLCLKRPWFRAAETEKEKTEDASSQSENYDEVE